MDGGRTLVRGDGEFGCGLLDRLPLVIRLATAVVIFFNRLVGAPPSLAAPPASACE